MFLKNTSLKIDIKNILVYCSGFIIAFLAGKAYTFLPSNIYFILIGGLAFSVLVYYKLEWGIGLLIASMIYELNPISIKVSLTRIVALPILFICLMKILLGQKKLYLNKRTDSIILLLFIWMCLSIFYAKNLNLVIIGLLTYFQTIVTYIIIKSVIDNETELHKLIKVIVILSFVMSIAAMIIVIKNPDSNLFSEAGSNYTSRFIGTSNNPDKFAHSLIFMLTFSIYLSITKSKYFFIPVALFTFLIFSTFSRMGIVGLVVVFGLSMLIFVKLNKKWIIYSISFLFIITCSFLLFNKDNRMMNRVDTMRTREDGSIKTRMDLIVVSLDMGAKNPLLGVGLSNYEENSHLYGNKCHYGRSSHSGILEVLATLGLPALFLVIGLLYFSYKNIKSYQKKIDNDINPKVNYKLLLPPFIMITFIAHLAMAFFGPLMTHKLFWVLLAFCGILEKFSKKY